VPGEAVWGSSDAVWRSVEAVVESGEAVEGSQQIHGSSEADTTTSMKGLGEQGYM